MKIIPSNYDYDTELPLKFKLSFEAIYEHLENIEQDKNHLFHDTAKQLLKKYNAFPILREGFEDLSNLHTYSEEIGGLLDILFPDMLQSNEIKAGSVPFEFTSFKLTNRFKSILENAPKDYKLRLRNYDHSNIFIMCCTFILTLHHKINIDFKRPFYFDIPDKKTGFTKNFRTLFNGDFFQVTPLPNAPKLTEDDIKQLMDNFDNIDLWMEKFPPQSYEFKGFGIMTLVDMTLDQTISRIKESLLNTGKEAILEVEKNMSELFNSKDIKFEFSSYSTKNGEIVYNQSHKQRSFVTFNFDSKNNNCNEYFCAGIMDKVFKSRELIAISDLDAYAERNNHNGFSQTLINQGYKSVILVPIELDEDNLGVMELVSPNKHELNSLSAVKLNDVIPAFKVAAMRYTEELENKMESIIQEHYTSIHPAVKWKFLEAAQDFIDKSQEDDSNVSLKEIVFDNVIPLYGQSDIKGSSIARNTSIQKDLVEQLQMAFNVIEKARTIINLPIYNDLQFRISEYSENIKHGLNTGDEVSLTYFLKKDIYPVFNHLKTLDKSLKKDVEKYMDHLDANLHVVYNERKKYDESVNKLNDKMAKFIDSKQIEAQNMFPHYFERYKTDGIDYNMYIGQSLLNNKNYNELYLYNLRLWQLQMMFELENVIYNFKDQLEHPLEVASLILVHSTPLTIKFRMDEKRFDVDGAYNIRYEILKKRIDKSKIKNTNERLTVPGKIAIVYTQEDEAEEYLKYLKHLQAQDFIKGEIEFVEIEDLQGSIGLKALRAEINYKKDSKQKITLDDLIDVIESKN